MHPVIQTQQLSKSYKGFQAVKNITLNIHKGEIYGFIGLNGAGKTTTIRMLLGMIKPTTGKCYINGENVSLNHNHIWEDVGYIVETPHSYPELTVQENLDIFRRYRLISNKKIVSKVIDQLQITRYTHTKAKHLSLGNAQRLGIAKALLHSPQILILDEPVNGLDPAGIVEIRNVLQDLAFNYGVTIFISSHLLSEIAKISTTIGMIHEGQLIEEMNTNKLNQLFHQRLIIDTNHNKSAISKLITTGYNASLNDQGYIQLFDKEAIQRPDKISKMLVYEGYPPYQLTVEEEDLEAYFLRMLN